MKILGITTGGTIGALPYENPHMPPKVVSMPLKNVDFVRDAFETTFSKYAVRCLSLEPLDSKFMDVAYRAELLSLIEEASEERILITHGTDALLDTADFFYEQSGLRAALEKKCIILTGAMTPLANGVESDGHLNLAFSLDQLAHSASNLAKVNIVLSDFDEDRNWKPRLYVHQPHMYEKFYDADRRYSRLKERQDHTPKP